MTDLNKLTKKELIAMIEAPKEELAVIDYPIKEFKNDSKYSEEIRRNLLLTLASMAEEEVKLTPAISKLNFDNFMTNGRIRANGLKQAVKCNAYSKDEMEVWLQHLSVVLVHELAKAIEKGVVLR